MPRLRTKQDKRIKNLSQTEAERLRNEFQLRPAAVKPDPAIVANGGASGLPSHTHTASQVSIADSGDLLTATDAEGAFAELAAKVAQGSAISDASGGSTVDTEARTAINAVLAYLRANGLIAT